MFRLCILCILAAIAVGQPGHPDSAFDDVSFDKWLKNSDDGRIQWTLRVFPPQLDEYQRLSAYIWAVVAADEFAARPNPGRMVLLMEIRDRDQHTYRSHRALSLPKWTNPADFAGVKSIENVCVVPGDYEVAAAVYDTETREHSLKRAKLKVPEIAHDPLRSAWRSLPNVELSRECGPRDSSRLSLAVETRRPVHIDVVVNRPIERLGAYILGPRIEVLSEMEIPDGWMQVTSLDLQRRRSISQRVEGNLELRRVWTRPLDNRRYTVNVHTLENEKGGAQFFVSEVGKLLDRPVPEAEHVLIVLSNPRRFPKGEDLRPIQAKIPTGTHVFYIRCDYRQYFAGPVAMSHPPGPGDWSTPPELPSGPGTQVNRRPDNSDSLEQTLRPLDPRVYHVTTPLQFRNAVAEMMTEISRL
jgi:hypothetical protein